MEGANLLRKEVRPLPTKDHPEKSGVIQYTRQAAEAAGYGHTYIEGPGDHEWPYWDKAVQLAFQFFCGLDMATTPIY